MTEYRAGTGINGTAAAAAAAVAGGRTQRLRAQTPRCTDRIHHPRTGLLRPTQRRGRCAALRNHIAE